MTTPYVLLVEDDADQIFLTLQVLKRRLPEVEVVVKQDGDQALEFLTGGTRPPSVVLLDLKMPKVGGLEVLARIRSDQRLHLLPVVILTSSDEASDLTGSYRLGANSYVRKPVDYRVFADSIEQIVTYWTRVNNSPMS